MLQTCFSVMWRGKTHQDRCETTEAKLCYAGPNIALSWLTHGARKKTVYASIFFSFGFTIPSMSEAMEEQWTILEIDVFFLICLMYKTVSNEDPNNEAYCQRKWLVFCLGVISHSQLRCIYMFRTVHSVFLPLCSSQIGLDICFIQFYGIRAIIYGLIQFLQLFKSKTTPNYHIYLLKQQNVLMC